MKDFRNEYRQKLRSPEEAVAVVKDGDWIDYTSCLGKPILLDILCITAGTARRMREGSAIKGSAIIFRWFFITMLLIMNTF